MTPDEKCSRCKAELIEIDHYGERLVGCINCNRWSWRGSDRLFMELPEEDIQAFRKHDRKTRSV
jgi:hypothetical protein